MTEISTSFMYQFPQIKRMVKSDLFVHMHPPFFNDETGTRLCPFSLHREGGALGGSKEGQNWRREKKKLETKTKSCTELSMASLLTLTVLRSASSTTQMDWTLKLAFKSFTHHLDTKYSHVRCKLYLTMISLQHTPRSFHLSSYTFPIKTCLM